MKTQVQKTIYYDDTDAGGVVYHANYLRYMDHARSEFLTASGFDFHVLQDEEQKAYVVGKVTISYRKSCQLGDKIVTTAAIKKIGRTSIDFEQTVLRNNELMSEAVVTVVIIDLITKKPVKIPTSIIEAIDRAK